MKKLIIWFLAGAVIFSPVAAFAESPWMEGPTYNERVSGKFQLGLKNTLLGWCDLFIEPIHAGSHCNDCENVWTGIGKGFTDAIVNTLGGAAQLLTFPIPVDFPLPENGVQFSSCCGSCGKK